MIHVFWSLLFLIGYNFDKKEEIPESNKRLELKWTNQLKSELYITGQNEFKKKLTITVYGFDLIDIKSGQEKNA